MNILLFSMPDSFEHMPTIAVRMPNGALTSLAGNVDPHHRVAAADLVLVQNRVRETVERLLAEHEPDVVGLSVMTFQRKTANGIIDLVRARRPRARVVVGGYDPSLASEAYTEDPDGGVDFIVRGEGEITSVSCCARSSLRTAWKDGEVRPTIIAKAKPKRLRRRPDPFAAVTTELREWFETEPWRTSRELLERLQAQYPGIYPEGQLRTLQRRLKEWRRGAAHRMVFGTMTVDPGDAPGDGEGRLLSNSANYHFSDRQGGAKSPVDLPLRLDDARTSPTNSTGPTSVSIDL
jgi:radical SAM superfamily enzyme YgiQ (UPF0313 family)